MPDSNRSLRIMSKAYNVQRLLCYVSNSTSQPAIVIAYNTFYDRNIRHKNGQSHMTK